MRSESVFKMRENEKERERGRKVWKRRIDFVSFKIKEFFKVVTHNALIMMIGDSQERK